MAVHFPLKADRAGVVVIMPVTLSGVTSFDVRGISTSWTPALSTHSLWFTQNCRP
jgi:hypothetical protein